MRTTRFLALAAILPAAPALASEPPASPVEAASQPAPPRTQQQSASAAPADSGCNVEHSASNAAERDILVCGTRNGTNPYRIDPDIIAARKAKKAANFGRQKPPENFKPDSCSPVGPMGCQSGPAIDFLSVALTAAEMAKRLSEGKEIGSMFKTTPQKDEYDFYREAKAQREEREAAAAADAMVKQARARAHSVAADAKPAAPAAQGIAAPAPAPAKP